jgi:ABC-2 type transport system permease protein
MRKTWLIAAREYNAAVRTKAFLIGIVLAPMLMGGGLIAFVLLEGRVDTTPKTIAVVDRTGIVAPGIVQAAKARNEIEIFDAKTGKQTKPVYRIEIVQPNDENPEAQRVELSDQVRRKELQGFVEIGKDAVHPGSNPEGARITYYGENAVMDDAYSWIGQPINNRIRSLRLAEAGVSEKRVESLLSWMPVEPVGLVSVDPATGQIREAQRSSEGLAFGVPFAMIMLMFLMLMMGAVPLINSVLEEKTQRISEVLLGSARPFEIMMGKLLGHLGVSFTAAVVYVVVAFFATDRMGIAQSIPFDILPWFFAYMISAVFMFGAMSSAVGAAVNEIKEAQNLQMPVMMPAMIPLFVWLPVMKEPLSGFSTWMSLFPPFTPFLMLVRQSSPVEIPAWQPWVGLAGVIGLTIFMVWAAGRIFRVGLLMQGKPPRLGDLVRWAVRG